MTCSMEYEKYKNNQIFQLVLLARRTREAEAEEKYQT